MLEKYRIMITDIDNKPVAGAKVFFVKDRYSRDRNGLLATSGEVLSGRQLKAEGGGVLQNPIVCDVGGFSPLIVDE